MKQGKSGKGTHGSISIIYKYGQGHHPNSQKTQFKKGIIPANKGKPLEEFLGKSKAKQIQRKMSLSKRDYSHLSILNKDIVFLQKRKCSRRVHEQKVKEILKRLRNDGKRVFPLDYEKQPDLILFENGKIIAIEVEAIKRYKPSSETIKKRYESRHKEHGFFDEVKIIWIDENNPMVNVVEV